MGAECWCSTEVAEQLLVEKAKTTSRVMAWLKFEIVGTTLQCNQSIDNCYFMFMCHVSMTKLPHLIMSPQNESTNDPNTLNGWKEQSIGMHSTHSHIQVQSTIKKNLCNLSKVFTNSMTKISHPLLSDWLSVQDLIMW